MSDSKKNALYAESPIEHLQYVGILWYAMSWNEALALYIT
jgi:hypothetical protein